MKFFSFVCLLYTIHETCAVAVPNVKLSTGRDMPIIGIGTWQATNPQQVVKDALEIGYRHIDTANIYGNEGDVGRGLNAEISAGLVKREDVFVTTKVWPDGSNHDKALESIKGSLKAMNLTYLDLVLVHAPGKDFPDVYRGLESAYDQKLVRSIGISQFEVKHIEELMKTAKVKPAVNQIEVHPTRNQDETIDYCKKNGISITGFSPLGHGNLISNPTLVEIGKKHNKSASQVAIRWQIQRGLVVIPKSSHKAYIKENFEVFDFELSADEMTKIHAMK